MLGRCQWNQIPRSRLGGFGFGDWLGAGGVLTERAGTSAISAFIASFSVGSIPAGIGNKTCPTDSVRKIRAIPAEQPANTEVKRFNIS